MASDVDSLQIDKHKIQENLYSFPYHHIPHFDNEGVGVRFRLLDWGFEYLCYTRHVRELVESLSPSSVLDVGCGDGGIVGTLGPAIGRRVGVDISEQAIRFARAFHPDVDFSAIDVQQLEETFDVVLAVAVLEHIPDDQVSTFLKALEQRASKDGYVIILVPTTVFRVRKKHYRHYDLNLLKKQLEEADVQLTITNVEYVYRQSRVVKHYCKLTHNHVCFMEPRTLNRLIWNHVWKRLRRTDEEHGKHLVVVLRKAAANAL